MSVAVNVLDVSAENCPIGRTLDIVGTSWTLRVLREAFLGVRRFNEFRKRLDVSSALLTARLALLVEHGILTRVADERPGAAPATSTASPTKAATCTPS